MLLLSVILLPSNPFPNAYAQNLDSPRETKDKVAKIDSETYKLKNQALTKKASVGSDSVAEDIRVVLELDGRSSSSKIKELTKLDVKIEGQWKNLIEALVPPDQLDALAKIEFIKYIRQPVYALPVSTSEGAGMIGADEINAAGFTGQDVKVAVIDSGFDLASPEIAANIVESKSFRADGNITTSDPRHGTSVAEIIVDVAPDVQLYLYNVDTDVSLLNALDYIAEQHSVDIVSMSLALYNVGPYDGTSEISQAVNSIRSNGMLFVTAAGNDAKRHWDGNFVDSDADGWRNFSGADETMGIDAQAGHAVDVFLSWNDWPTSTQDYDLYVFNDALGIIGFSENPQFLGFAPVEHATFVASSTGTYHIGIYNFSATQDVSFNLFTSVDLKEYDVQSSSLNIPSDASGAFTVGAVFWQNGTLESFSSRGPTKDGRTKPDISGLDGVTTSTTNPFFGSSAATPYVSGAAALVKDVYPGADPDVIQSLLEENTLNNHAKNNDDGTGIVNVPFLLSASPVANAGVNQTINENAAVILDGTLSSDFDGTIVSYNWEQVGGDQVVSLDNATSVTSSFIAPSVSVDSELLFKLTVVDNLGATGSDTTTVNVKNVNQQPVANAGPDQIVNEGSIVTLNGTASSDSDEDGLSYLWTQLNGTLVVLSNNSAANPSFVAPSVDSTGATLAFQLTVDDGHGANGTDIVVINVQNINQPPVADAGSDQVVNEGTDPVIMNGTASFDPDGDSLTFSWIQIAGPTVTLSDSSSATPLFTAPEVGSTGDILTFELTVTDNDLLTSTDRVNIRIENINQLPIADAGPDQTVNEGDSVSLNATASSDQDGDGLLFSWTQTAGPAVALSDATSATPSFAAPEVGPGGAVLTFELTVTDGLANSNDTVDITINNIVVNQPPVADAGADQTVDEGSVVVLDGAASSDPDGDTLTYSWIQTAGPVVSLSGADTSSPSFTAPGVDSIGTILTFELSVGDGKGGIATDAVNVSVQNVNHVPVANPGPDQTVNEGEPVTLNGTDSSDPDGDNLTFSWLQTNGTPVSLSAPNAAVTSFAAPTVNADGDTLTFELTVTDIDGLTNTDIVNIFVVNVNQPPVADAGSDQVVNEGTGAVILNGSASDDADGDSLSFSWTQIAGPTVTLSDSTSTSPTFAAPEVGVGGATLTFELSVDDGEAISTDRVDINVNNVNGSPEADAGADQIVEEGTVVNLDGTGSFDPDGDDLVYSWIQTDGTAVILSDATSSSPSFIAPTVDGQGDTMAFELTVTDNDGLTGTDVVNIVVQNVNQSPVADAGPDSAVNEGAFVSLSATGSADPDNDSLTYTWTQLSGTSVELNDADTANPSFVAPSVDSTGATLAFQLTVDDGHGANGTDTVDINVQNINQPPVADAGSDQVVNEGTGAVILNGSASHDPDGDSLSFSWTQTAGPAVALSDTTSATPSFAAPEVDSGGAVLTFQLTVTDGLANSNDTVDITVSNVEVNQPPIANAGPDQTVEEGSLVTLNGAASTDPDGDISSFNWIQLSGPPVTLSDENIVSPTFIAPNVGSAGATLVFRLAVNDGNGESDSDEVSIIVDNVNGLPSANAGTDQTVEEGEFVTLDGSASTDPDGDTLTYSWTQILGPPAILSDSNVEQPTFIAPNVGPGGATLRFNLTVTDSNTLSNSDIADVFVNNVNQDPTADAGSDEIVEEGAVVTLNGTASSDPESDPLAFSWVQTNGATVELTGADSATPSFIAPIVDAEEILTFELTVTDSGSLTDTDTVDITVTPLPVENSSPVADAGSNQTVQEGALVTLDGTASSDPDGDALSYSWLQIGGPTVTLSDNAASTPTFSAPSVDPAGATITFELTVQDSNNASDTDTVEIIVTNVNIIPIADAGLDQDAVEDALVTLNGSNSMDDDGTIESYSWVQTNGTLIVLDDPASAIPSFTAPEVGSTGDILTFELTVTDNDLLTSTDRVNIRIENINQLPIADAGPDQTVNEGDSVSLNATASSDQDGDGLLFSWTQINGTFVVLIDADTANPSFTAPEVDSGDATLTFQLTVSDGSANSNDTVDITVNNIVVNQPPTADAGPDQTVREGATVTVNGGGSSDSDGSIVSFSWQQESGPAVVMSDSSSASFTFLAPKIRTDTNLAFRLTVTDNDNSSSQDVVNIQVSNKGVHRHSGGGSGISTSSGESTVLPASFFLVDQTAKITVQSASFTDLDGLDILHASEGQQIQVVSTMQNQQQSPQLLAYIVQISDENGITVDLAFQQTSIGAGQSITLGSSWQSSAPGIYRTEVFIWESLGEAPVPLASVTERTITIV